ncbi:MAG: ABC transporter ATP-binding protein [Treponema sp.]|nr:ABC transporter ATP-binding protein [Treponema sp.]
MIELSNVFRDFGNFRAVNNISFSIPTGQIVGLLGPNGAGKTTTMRMISGFIEPTSGTIKIDGIDIHENPVEAKKKIGYMPESAPLYQDMIVEDYLNYIAEIHNEDASVKVPQLCEECGLKEVMSKNISELSRGNRQRVALAHALMHDPEILILDEPTSGLDPNQVEDVRSIIREIGKTRTVIVSTHILSEVETLCSRAIIISGGKLVADSSIEELKNSIKKQTTVYVTLKCAEKNEFAEIEKLTEKIDGVVKAVCAPLENDLCRLEISVKENYEIRPKLITALVKNNYDLYEVSISENSLEDVFHELTSGNSTETVSSNNVSENLGD